MRRRWPRRRNSRSGECGSVRRPAGRRTSAAEVSPPAGAPSARSQEAEQRVGERERRVAALRAQLEDPALYLEADGAIAREEHRGGAGQGARDAGRGVRRVGIRDPRAGDDRLSDRPRWRMLGLLALAEVLGMSLWFSASAVSEQYRAQWSLSAAETGWLTTVVQLGFVVGTAAAALLNLADVAPSRWYFAVSGTLGAAANAVARRGGGLSDRTGVPLPDRRVPRRRLSARDEDGRHLVPDRSRPRHRRHRGVVDGGQGDAVPGPRAGRERYAAGRARRVRRRGPLGGPGGVRLSGRTARVSPAALLLAPGERRGRGTEGPGSPPPATWATCGSSTRCGPGCRRSSPRASRSGPAGPRAVARPEVALVAFGAIAAGGLGAVWGGWAARRLGYARVVTIAMAASGGLLARDRCVLRRAALAARAGRDRLGILRRRRLGPVQRDGDRAVAPARRRHGAHAPDLARLPPHHGHDPDDPGARGEHRVAAGRFRCWRSGPAAGIAAIRRRSAKDGAERSSTDCKYLLACRVVRSYNRPP